MSYDLAPLGVDHPLLANDGQSLRRAAHKLIRLDAVRYRRLWNYYANPMRVVGHGGDVDGGSERPYRLAQEWGLPSRLTAEMQGAEPFTDVPIDGVTRKEVVIENDIGWRVDTSIDYLFGQPLVIDSDAPDPNRAAIIGELLRLILAHNGGITFLQKLALLGSVYGFVDVLVKLDAPGTKLADCHTEDIGRRPLEGEAPLDSEALAKLASRIRLEIVEASRALPILSPTDPERVEAYAQVYELPTGEIDAALPGERSRSDWLRNLLPIVGRRSHGLSRDEPTLVVELVSRRAWQIYHDDQLVASGTHPLGTLPLVHVQNLAMPFAYAGPSEVEPLIPLQDELNTRLSDRASRVAMQCFKMYLGKGIEGFADQEISPGRMWESSDPAANVIEFGGDSNSPSEDAAISDVREALDKLSGVNPIAAGAVKNRIGRLTSAAALRVTLLALLARTQRKRTSYGLAIGRMCELSLAWLDAAGLFKTTPIERRVKLNWPHPLPAETAERLEEAKAKLALGIDADIVRRELGY